MATTYWQGPNYLGGPDVLWAISTPEQTPKPGWVSLTLAQYNTAVASQAAADTAAGDAAILAECLVRKASYDWLILQGSTIAVASMLSGWNLGDC